MPAHARLRLSLQYGIPPPSCLSALETGIPLTGVLQIGVFGIVDVCLALMRKLVFRDHQARVLASRENTCQVTRKPLLPKPLLREPQESTGSCAPIIGPQVPPPLRATQAARVATEEAFRAARGPRLSVALRIQATVEL